jgi:hypothetical protein
MTKCCFLGCSEEEDKFTDGWKRFAYLEEESLYTGWICPDHVEWLADHLNYDWSNEVDPGPIDLEMFDKTRADVEVLKFI